MMSRTRSLEQSSPNGVANKNTYFNSDERFEPFILEAEMHPAGSGEPFHQAHPVAAKQRLVATVVVLNVCKGAPVMRLLRFVDPARKSVRKRVEASLL